MDYGCFVRIEDGIEGLIHNSELDWTNKNVKPSKILSVSQKIKFKIVNIDKDTKKFLYLIKLHNNPWDELRDKENQEVKIKISNITDKTIFGEILNLKLSGILHYKGFHI